MYIHRYENYCFTSDIDNEIKVYQLKSNLPYDYSLIDTIFTDISLDVEQFISQCRTWILTQY